MEHRKGNGMKRSLIIGAALLVQSAVAQETNQLDKPTEAPLKFFGHGYAYKSPFEPARKVEGEWVFIPAGRDTSGTNLNFIHKPGWQISEETNEPPTSVPTRFQAWTFPKAGDGSTNEKSVNGFDEYVQSGDYEAKTNDIPELFTVISNVFVVDPDAIERENSARHELEKLREEALMAWHRKGVLRYSVLATLLGMAAGYFIGKTERPMTNR